MAREPARFRPKIYPPPEFPPRRVPLFSRTPPAIFPPILGLLGLVAAMRLGIGKLGLAPGIGDLATGLVLPLWGFAMCIYIAKMIRRISVIEDDLKVMPARAGLAAATMGGMVAAGLLSDLAPRPATGILVAMLVLHSLLVLLTVRTLAGLPPEARGVNPGWHMTFAGFVVAAPAAQSLGLPDLAGLLFLVSLPAAVAIWSVSLWQVTRHIPAAPLRPMLAFHLFPAAFLVMAASLTGHELLATVFAWALLVLLLAAGAALRWITVAGFSPLWGAFGFPLAAAATALLLQGGALGWAGLALLVPGLAVVPWIALRILRLWPGGRLAARTNAAEA